MHLFLRHIRRSHKHSSQSTQPTATVGRKTNTRKGKTQVSNEDFDGDSWQRRGISLPCPDIHDNGSPTPNRYADPGLYWNSVMLEADSPNVPSQQQLSSATGRYNSSASSYTIHDLSSPTNTTQTQRFIGRMGSGSVGMRYNNRDSSTIETRLIQPSQPIGFAKGLKDNDLAIFRYEKPTDTRGTTTPVLAPMSPEASLSPRTRRYSEFIDFPYYRPSNITEFNRERDIFTAQRSDSGFGVSLCDPSCFPSNTTELTWNSCLHTTLHHPDTDPATQTAIDERVRRTKITNGTVKGSRIPLNIQDAGLVPNFSRPFRAAGFCDCVTEENSTRQAMNHEPLSNRSVTTNNRLDRFVFEEPQINGINPEPKLGPQVAIRELTNGYTSSSRHSPSTSSTTLDSLYRPPTPAGEVINGAISELPDTLTSSELNALHKILTTKSKSSPIEISLIRKLHSIVQDLQDSTKHVEKSLWPQLSEDFEQKSKVIDMLIAGNENLDTVASNLGITVDFGNKILQGCWAREYELWRMFIYLRDKKRYQCLRKLFKKFIPTRQREMSPNAGEKHQLSRSELGVLVLIAEQNLKILKDDVGDMVGMVEVCMSQMTSCGVDWLRERK